MLERDWSREGPATSGLKRGACGLGHSGLGEEEVMPWGQGCEGELRQATSCASGNKGAASRRSEPRHSHHELEFTL